MAERRRLDSLGMAEAVRSIPAQLAIEPSQLELEALRGRRIECVVVAGDATARRAGEAVRAVLSDELAVPLEVSGLNALPPFVGPATLVCLLARAPDDEPARRLVSEALDRRATVVIFSFGDNGLDAEGSLAVSLPAVPRRRVGLCALVANLLGVLSVVGLASSVADRLEAASEQATTRLRMPTAYEPLFSHIARRIGHTFPYLLGASGIGAEAAIAWRAAISANAKSPAFAASVPELFDDEIAAFGQAGDVTRQVATLVYLRSEFEPPAARRAFPLVDELLSEVFSDSLEVHGKGEGSLAAYVDLVLTGELVALELAAALGVDPGPAPAIDEWVAADMNVTGEP